jgi:DUF917 family protein
VINMIRKLNKDDVWALVLGAGALATGGGASVPSYEQFSANTDPVLDAGHEAKLMDPGDLKDDDLVFMDVGCGGGIRREYQEVYMRYHPRDAWYKQYDLIYPLNSWSQPENMRETEGHLKKLEELTGGKPVAYLGFEVGPLDAGQLLNAAKRGLPLVDADCCGYRAVPELSLTGLNIIDAPIAPYTIGTSWGDLIIGTKVLSHQRWEDICRAIATRSGGGCSPAMAMTGKTVKEGTAAKTFSLAIDVGKAILEARESGGDPVAGVVESSGGYKIFEGEVGGYTNERKGAFVYGNVWIEGTGDYAGKTFRLWYKNENQISWIDEKPFVTCPDPFTVLDKNTGLGLSNFRSEWWTPGREVAVTAMKAYPFWRTEKGLRIYNPKHFGFDIPYVPIEEKLG